MLAPTRVSLDLLLNFFPQTPIYSCTWYTQRQKRRMLLQHLYWCYRWIVNLQLLIAQVQSHAHCILLTMPAPVNKACNTRHIITVYIQCFTHHHMHCFLSGTTILSVLMNTQICCFHLQCVRFFCHTSLQYLHTIYMLTERK